MQFINCLSSLPSRISNNVTRYVFSFRSRRRRPIFHVPLCPVLLSSRKRQIPFLGSRRYVSSKLEEHSLRPVSYRSLYSKDPEVTRRKRSSPETKKVKKISQRILLAMYDNLKIGGVFSVNGHKIKLHAQESNGVGHEFEYLKGMSWKIDVVQTDMPSLCWGSSIFITCADIAISKSDDELARTIAHEIAHVVASHVCESYYYVLHELYNKLDVLEISFNYWSQWQEFEADLLGLMLAAIAGYDPRLILESINEENLEFFDEEDVFSTHPSWRRRREFLSNPQIMEKVMKLYGEAAGNYENGKLRWGEGKSKVDQGFEQQ